MKTLEDAWSWYKNNQKLLRMMNQGDCTVSYSPNSTLWR